jgi:hypothetical protein
MQPKMHLVRRHNFHKSVACKTPHFLFTDALDRNYSLRSVYTVKFSAAPRSFICMVGTTTKRLEYMSTCSCSPQQPAAPPHNKHLKYLSISLILAYIAKTAIILLIVTCATINSCAS